MYRRAIKFLLITIFVLAIPYVAHAGFLDDIAYCTGTGDCGLVEIAIGFNSLIRLLLGGMGAVALIYFVWGGVQWLVSGGNMEKVARGRTIMINTVFAMILAFGSYLLVTFFVNDVLNPKPEFRIQEGEFQSCFETAPGTACGDSRQCVGQLPDGHEHEEQSGKCLYNCVAENLGYTKLPRCVLEVNTAGGWSEIIGIDLCPDNQKCSLPPQT